MRDLIRGPAQVPTRRPPGTPRPSQPSRLARELGVPRGGSPFAPRHASRAVPSGRCLRSFRRTRETLQGRLLESESSLGRRGSASWMSDLLLRTLNPLQDSHERSSRPAQRWSLIGLLTLFMPDGEPATARLDRHSLLRSRAASIFGEQRLPGASPLDGRSTTWDRPRFEPACAPARAECSVPGPSQNRSPPLRAHSGAGERGPPHPPPGAGRGGSPESGARLRGPGARRSDASRAVRSATAVACPGEEDAMDLCVKARRPSRWGSVSLLRSIWINAALPAASIDKVSTRIRES